jgi:hypothetical protein
MAAPGATQGQGVYPVMDYRDNGLLLFRGRGLRLGRLLRGNQSLFLLCDRVVAGVFLTGFLLIRFR